MERQIRLQCSKCKKEYHRTIDSDRTCTCGGRLTLRQAFNRRIETQIKRIQDDTR